MPKKVVLASGNAGKLREFFRILGNEGFEIVAQSEYDVTDVPETGLTFVENAIIKARNAAQQTGLPALADDSGIEVDALNGRPGIYSARYSGEGDEANNLKLLEEMKDIPDAKRTARFRCCIVYMRHAEDPSPLIADASWEGIIMREPSGANGFGYDPLFFVPNQGTSSAELNPDENIDINRNGIVLANHQSTWETMMIPMLFPPVSWVLKKELFKIPFFGWALSMVKPIAIDRESGSTAIDQVKLGGKERLDEGNWVCIFPEGTRVVPGAKARYRMGGALLAEYCAQNTPEGSSGYPVYPLAHNAGKFWPRHSFIKLPGTITVSIGEPFYVEGMEPGEINAKVKSWIETEVEKMPSP
ncbi:dITP/XTP pyrophosphatase [Nymphon striatum]|nr:dITP/XTP pyrophosphatase [Nymphon striatum]